MSQRPPNDDNFKKKKGGGKPKFTSNYGNPSPSVKSTEYGNNNPEGKPQKRSILQQIHQNFHEADEKGVLEKVGQNTETLGGMTITVEQVVFTINIDDDIKPELINEIFEFSNNVRTFTNGTDLLKYIINMKKEGNLQFLNISSSGLDTKIDAMFKDIILITNSFERLLQRELNELDQDSSEKNQNEIKFLTTYIELLDMKNKAGEISSDEREFLEDEEARLEKQARLAGELLPHPAQTIKENDNLLCISLPKLTPQQKELLEQQRKRPPNLQGVLQAIQKKKIPRTVVPPQPSDLFGIHGLGLTTQHQPPNSQGVVAQKTKQGTVVQQPKNSYGIEPQKEIIRSPQQQEERKRQKAEKKAQKNEKKKKTKANELIRNGGAPKIRKFLRLHQKDPNIEKEKSALMTRLGRLERPKGKEIPVVVNAPVVNTPVYNILDTDTYSD